MVPRPGRRTGVHTQPGWRPSSETAAAGGLLTTAPRHSAGRNPDLWVVQATGRPSQGACGKPKRRNQRHGFELVWSGPSRLRHFVWAHRDERVARGPGGVLLGSSRSCFTPNSTGSSRQTVQVSRSNWTWSCTHRPEGCSRTPASICHGGLQAIDRSTLNDAGVASVDPDKSGLREHGGVGT